MAEISDFLVIDDNNVARWPEGMAFAQVNNSARADEGLLARWFLDTNGSLTTGGISTAYTLTPNRTITSYYAGLCFRLQFNLACGAAPTINVASLGAKNLTREGNVAINANDLQAGRVYDVVYDGTQFQVVELNLAPLILAASGAQPLTARRTENDATPRKAFSVQSGSGAGNDYSINETGDGSNNVATVTRQIGATVIETDTITSKGLPLPLDLTEVATPAAPGAGLIRFYAKTGTGQLAFREGVSGAEVAISPVALASAQGLTIANNGTTPNTKIDITAGQAILTTSAGVPIFYSGGTNTVDLTVNGANGLDTGSKAATTWYFLYLISDGTNFKGLASLSSTAPTMPANYIYKMRAGAMQTDGSGNLYRTRQLGKHARYQITGGTNTSTFPFVTSGSTGTTWTAKQVTGNGFAAPATAAEVDMNLVWSNNNSFAFIAPNANYFVNGTVNPTMQAIFSASTNSNGSITANYLLESNSIYWLATASGPFGEVIGWTDAVNAC